MYPDTFDFAPVFIANSDALSGHNDNYFGFSTNFNLAGNSGDLTTGHVVPSQSGDLDSLGALLSMYSIPMQQQPQHAGHWSNQTTPELNPVGHDTPLVNPITSVIDQSMTNINMVPPAVPSPWDSTNYSSFAYLPSLYPNGPMPKDTVTSVADAAIGTHPLLTGMSFGVTPDMAAPVQMKQQIDPETVRKQIFYYFNRVRKMQYCLAGESTKDVLRDLVVSDPHISRPFHAIADALR
jgi:hypothetical protein